MEMTYQNYNKTEQDQLHDTSLIKYIVSRIQLAITSFIFIISIQIHILQSALQFIVTSMNLPFRPAFLWVDLQMSGLNPHQHRILEFACVLTDDKLKHQKEGPHIIIHCDQQHLETMDEWCTKHHGDSGLTASCLASAITVEQAQQQIMQYLINLGINPRQLIIAGNSVHMDKLFLMYHMPRLNQFLHYRILDVTSLKIVVNATNPNLFYKKKEGHRALDDIRQSIGELEYYMKHAMK